MPQEASIVLIEDESEIVRFLKTTLPAHGFHIHEATTGQQGMIEVKTRNPDLILLDLGLPDMEGTEVIRHIREWTSTPIIVLSAREQEQQKVAVLDLGADDYVTKPFGINELLARIRTALRHAARPEGPAADSCFTFGNVRVDLGRRLVFADDKEVRLTAIEYKLLATLVRYAGKVVTHRQLLTDVWGPGHVEQTHYLRLYMGQLRAKLETDPAEPQRLLTEPGIGYRLAEPAGG